MACCVIESAGLGEGRSKERAQGENGYRDGRLLASSTAKKRIPCVCPLGNGAFRSSRYERRRIVPPSLGREVGPFSTF